MSIKTKVLAAALAVAIAGTASWGAGLWQTLPIIGGAAYCASSNVSGNAQGGITGQGSNAASANQTTGTVICQVTEPAGPPALVGTEVVPVDLYTPGTQVSAGGASTTVLPMTSLANGYGTTVIWTTTGTGQNPVMANGVSHLIYSATNTTATFATLTLPPNPINNQTFCISNAATSSSLLTLSSIVVGTSGQSIVGVAPTSLPVMTAVGTAGTVTLGENCWLYQTAGTSWYRIL